MLRLRLFRSFGSLVGALLIASCADPALQSLTAPVDVAAAKGPGSGATTTSVTNPAADLELHALWWSKKGKTQVRVSQRVDQSGGRISIPETGFTMDIPAGALSSPLTITVTADDRYVAYKMEPTGTQFNKDVTITQSLHNTTIAGQPLRTSIFAAYIADDNAKLSGKVPVLEIEPSTTVFSPLSARLPEAQVWIIRHFSRYMLASG
jgi:ZU5 domain